MRTTLDIPDETFRRAKIAAVERGTTLRELVGQALAKELGLEPQAPRKRAKFPLFKSKQPGSLTAEAMQQAELEDDERQDGLTR